MNIDSPNWRVSVSRLNSCLYFPSPNNFYVRFQMEQYIYKRRSDGAHIINLRRTWEKLQLAARAIAAIDHSADVFAISSRPFGQRAVLKFSSYTGATPIAGRFTPGAFTNQVCFSLFYLFTYFNDEFILRNHWFLMIICTSDYVEVCINI